MADNENQRLASLDLLRGFDLFLLLMFQPILVQILTTCNNPSLQGVIHQFEHTEWHGFTFWDIIMPLFMFMSGITIPFALSKYKDGRLPVDGKFYWKITKRFIILFVLGWIVQGNLLALDPHNFYIYDNTLQSIAVGYIVAAFLFVRCSIKWQMVWCALFFILYIAVFAVFGHSDYTQGSNIAEAIDCNVLGQFRNGIIWNGDTWSFDPTYHYTWLLSSFNFIVTVMMGSFAGYILKGSKEQNIKLKFLIIIGIACIAVSLIIDPVLPIIKRIWSSSMTLLSGGICFLFMALFYYIVDMKGRKKGIEWMKYYGMNSLVAYCMFEVVKFSSISDSLFFGLKQYMGDFYSVVTVTVQVIIVYSIVRWMYHHHVFIKA